MNRVKSLAVTRGVDAFTDELRERGVRAALAWLNARVPHRFTGIYRFDPPILRNVRLFDRENPTLDIVSDAPLRETYCSIIGETGHAFAVTDALHDERVRDHPARTSVLSYCGVPLRDDSGVAFGTLCHFDLVAGSAHPDEIRILEAVAPLLVGALRERRE
jgi:GAF domain-containing protein